MNKKDLRKKYLSLREAISSSEVSEKSCCIMNRLTSSEWFSQAQTIMTYLSIRNEVDTWGLARLLLELGKNLIIPITDLKEKKMLLSQVKDLSVELELGTYGIMEPKKEYIQIVDKNTVDIIIVPGLVFDELGYRIGYGGGFYDRLLQDLDSHVKTIGVAYDYQVTDRLIPDPYDQKVNVIITEERIVII